MPLSSVLNGPESSSSILLFTDCLRQPALTLFKAQILNLTRGVDTVHVYLYETRRDTLLNSLPASVLSKIVTHDLLSDPLGWDDATGPDSVFRGSLPTCIYKDRYAIVIDSLSSMVHDTSAHRVCQWFHGLTTTRSERVNSISSGCRQVVAVVHRDLHDQSTLQMLEHTADSVVALDDTEPSLCKVVEKTGKGKKLPRITLETFTVDQYFNVRSSPLISTTAPKATSSRTPTSVAAMSKLTDNLTFNSTVSREESEARSKLVLPYVHTGQSSGDQSLGLGGRIDGKKDAESVQDEQLDEEDDDYQDPDDDLDI